MIKTSCLTLAVMYMDSMMISMTMAATTLVGAAGWFAVPAEYVAFTTEPNPLQVEAEATCEEMQYESIPAHQLHLHEGKGRIYRLQSGELCYVPEDHFNS